MTRVLTLVGRNQAGMARDCLRSLARCAEPPLTLVVLSDGSLGEAERDALRAAVPGVEFAPDTDARVENALARYPACAGFRRDLVLARKLFDVALLEAGVTFAYVDADVLFARPFARLFDLPAGVSALFQQDVQEAYSVRSWDLWREPRLVLRSRINTGVVVFRREAFDLDLLEWFLSRREWARTPAWLEQTAWALLAGRVRCHVLESEQIAIAGGAAADPVAVHFVSSRRAGLAPALAAWRDRGDEPRVGIRSHPAATCGPLRLLGSELRRRLTG